MPSRCFNHDSTTTHTWGKREGRAPARPLASLHIHSSHRSGVGLERNVPAPPSARDVRTRKVATCYDRGRGRTHGHRRQYEDTCKRGPNKLRPSHQCTTHSTPMRRVRPGRYRAQTTRDLAFLRHQSDRAMIRRKPRSLLRMDGLPLIR